MICERLLKEQEDRLRYEYETALNQRLNGKEKLHFWNKCQACTIFFWK